MVDHFPFVLERLRGYRLAENIPVILITAGNAPFVPGLWRKLHKEMVVHSVKHKLIITEGNGHDILTENPLIVLYAVIELVKTIQPE
jgi:hypothetical protein